METKHLREWAAPVAALFILVSGVFVAAVYVASIHGPNAGDLRIPVFSGAMSWFVEKIPGTPQADAAVVDEGRRARVAVVPPSASAAPVSAETGHPATAYAALESPGVVSGTGGLLGEPPVLAYPNLPALGVPVPTSVRVSIPTVPSPPLTTIALPVGGTSTRFDDEVSSSAVYRSDLADAAAFAGSSASARSKSSSTTSSAGRQVASVSRSASAREPVRSSTSGTHDGGGATTTQAVHHTATKSTTATSDSRVGHPDPPVGNKGTNVRVAPTPKASVSGAGSRVHVSPSRSVPSVPSVPQSSSRVRSGPGTTTLPMTAPSSSRHESGASSRSGGGHR